MSSPKIPILDLKTQYATIKNEILSALDDVLESQQFILGPQVEVLEQKLAEYCQCKFAFGVSSGTDALLLSLMALGIQPGDEVITTPYSFFSSTSSIVRLGAKPVFVDIHPGTLNIDTERIETNVTPRTKAILPVHLAGQMVDMDPIMDIATRHGLYVVEDACQAIGADYKGKKAGSIGHVGCFSFYPSKNLGGYGDSGLVTCNDGNLADKLLLLRNHGQRPKYNSLLVGGNFRMDAIQAAVLLVKFRHLEQWLESRRRHAAEYHRLFVGRGIALGLNELSNKPGITFPEETGFGRHTYHLYIIRSIQRDDLRKYLLENGIGTEIYYPIPLHLQECIRNLGYQLGDFPESERAARETLAIPIYPEMTGAMLTQVVDTIAKYVISLGS